MNLGRMDMPENKSNDSRRKLLKSIAAGSGVIVAGKSLQEKWTRPVVDSVMLPAHAQTSPTAPTAQTYQGTATTDRDRCDGTSDNPTPDITIVIDGSTVSITYTNNRPFTGTGTLTGNTFSVAVSRTEDCAAPLGRNDGTGTVTGTISGTQITGGATVGGTCDCPGNTAPSYTVVGTYTASLV